VLTWNKKIISLHEAKKKAKFDPQRDRDRVLNYHNLALYVYNMIEAGREGCVFPFSRSRFPARRNRFLGDDSWVSLPFTNSGSGDVFFRCFEGTLIPFHRKSALSGELDWVCLLLFLNPIPSGRFSLFV
jgi:hypothetical protein